MGPRSASAASWHSSRTTRWRTANWGTPWRGWGQLDQAVDCYRRALQLRPDLDPGLASTWATRCGAAVSPMRRCRATKACGLRLRPEDPGPLAELAALLMHRGELDAAVAGYEELLRLKPDSAAGYSNMGLALMGLGLIGVSRGLRF